MYSLGVVMHAVFNEGKPVFQVNKHDIFKSFSRQLDQVSWTDGALPRELPSPSAVSSALNSDPCRSSDHS